MRSLRDIAIPLAERPARGDLTGEVCHWADGYHLNVRLYEKLLLSVFDILDEGKLTEVRIHDSLSWYTTQKIKNSCSAKFISLHLSSTCEVGLKALWKYAGIFFLFKISSIIDYSYQGTVSFVAGSLKIFH